MFKQSLKSVVKYSFIAALAILATGISNPAVAFTFPDTISVSRGQVMLRNTASDLGGSTCGNSCDGKICAFYAIPSADSRYTTTAEQLEHGPEAASVAYYSESHQAFLGHTGTIWKNATAEMGAECYYYTGFSASQPVCHMLCYDQNSNRTHRFSTNKNREENLLTEDEEQEIVYNDTIAIAKKILPILTCPNTTKVMVPTAPDSVNTLEKAQTAPVVKMTAAEKKSALKKATAEYNAALKAAKTTYNQAIKVANATFQIAIKDQANNAILKAAKDEYNKVSKKMNDDMAAARRTKNPTLIASSRKNDLPTLNATKKTYFEAKKTYKRNHKIAVQDAKKNMNDAKKTALQTFQTTKADILAKYKTAKATTK